MLLNSAAIALLFIMFTGVGLLLGRTFFAQRMQFDRLMAAFWIGWTVTLAFLQVWHLFYRVDLLALAVVLAAGLAGWWRAWGGVAHWIREWRPVRVTLLLILAGFLLLALGNHVQFVQPHFDHGLYHQATVEWISRYAIVPGLGNLHHRLAFNNANFLYAALVDNGFLDQRAFYLSSTLLVFVLISQCAGGFFQFFAPGSAMKKTHLYYALMGPPVILYASTVYLSGFSPDIVVFVLQAVLAGEFLRLVETSTDPVHAGRQALLVVLLASAGIVVKLSFIAFGVLMLAGTLVLWRLRFRMPLQSDLRTWRIWALVGLIIIAPWLLRHVLLSGYLLFPSTLVSFPVPWRIPLPLTEPIAPIISNWARTHSMTIEYTGDWDWLVRWWKGVPLFVRIGLFCGVVTASSAAALTFAVRQRTPEQWGLLGLLVCSAAGLVYWFGMAPDYRFSGAMIWIFLAVGLVLVYELITSARLVQSPALLAYSLLLALTLWLSPLRFTTTMKRAYLVNPRPEAAVVEEETRGQTLTSQVTRSGLTVYMPPAPYEQCWLAPLPCTRPQDFIASLALFDPADMQKGFYIDKAER